MAELEQGLEELKVVKQAFKDNISANDVSTANVEFRDMPNLLKQMEKKLPAQTKNINPTTASQVVTADSGYKLSQVNVGAVNPADYYKPEQSLDITPKTTAQTITPSGNNVYNRVNVSAVTSAIDSNLIPTNIRKGKTILGVTGNLEADKPDQSKTISPKTSEQVVVADAGYELAKVTINPVTSSIDNNIQAGNIKKGVSILGVTGSLEATSTTTPILQEKSVNPTTSRQSVVADSGYDGLSKVNVEAVVPSEYYKPEQVANVTPTTNQQVITPSSNSVFNQVNVSAVTSAIDSNIKAENIKNGVSILGVVGSMQATSGSPKFGELVDGSIQSVESSDLSEVNEIRNMAFINCKNLTSVVIPSNITTIGASAFEGCSSLQTLILADGVTTIGASAFKGINASVINIPSTLSVLETEVFADNLALTSIAIPENITEIKDNAFSGCTNLTEITMESMTPPSVTSTSLPSSVTAIYVKYGAYDTYKAQWTDYADKIVRLPAIPSTITIIVNNYLNELVQGATVTIEGNGQAFTGTTNENGVFVQGDLQPETYTIYVADMDGFKTPEPVEIVVEENTQNSAIITYLEKPSASSVLSENTWDQIIEIAQTIANNNMTSEEVYDVYGWSKGDRTTYTQTDGKVIDVRIIGFNHDDLSDGSGKAGITFETVNCVTKSAFGSSIYDYYKGSTIVKTTLPQLRNKMPTELKNGLKTVDKKWKGTPGGSLQTTAQTLFLLSASEVGYRESSAGGGASAGGNKEGDVYSPVYVVNDKNPRIKTYDGEAVNWWTRSTSWSYSSQPLYITDTGSYSQTNSPGQSFGVSFAFCV